MTLPSPLRPGGVFNARRARPRGAGAEPPVRAHRPSGRPADRAASRRSSSPARAWVTPYSASSSGWCSTSAAMPSPRCSSAFPAFPLLWFTPVAEQRSTLLVLLLLGGASAAAVLGWRAERRGWMVGGAALGAGGPRSVPCVPPQQARALIVFGGDAGALVLGTALMASFFAPEDSVFRRGAVRWGLLVIGAAGFCDAASTWFAARRDPGEIPFGRIEGVGLSDPSVLVETTAGASARSSPATSRSPDCACWPWPHSGPGAVSVPGLPRDAGRSSPGGKSGIRRSGRAAQVPGAGTSQPFAARHRLDDAGQLLHSIGQRRRTGLEDERALHLVELVVEHRPYPAPPRSVGDLLRLRLASAPAGDDTLRIAAGHLLGGRRCAPALRGW